MTGTDVVLLVAGFCLLLVGLEVLDNRTGHAITRWLGRWF